MTVWGLGSSGSFGVRQPANLPWLESFSRFGHQVGATVQNLCVGNRFLQRLLERVPPLKRRNQQEGSIHAGAWVLGGPAFGDHMHLQESVAGED